MLRPITTPIPHLEQHSSKYDSMVNNALQEHSVTDGECASQQQKEAPAYMQFHYCSIDDTGAKANTCSLTSKHQPDLDVA